MIENHGVGGSIPPPGTTSIYGAGVAQLVEHLTRNEKVCGSIPHTSSIHFINQVRLAGTAGLFFCYLPVGSTDTLL